MNFETLVNDHWNMYIAFVSRFYPLSSSLLEAYEEEWDWQCLSLNESLAWDEALIRQFSDRWRWVDLSINPAIIWDEALLSAFEQDVDWRMLAYNPSLPVDASYLERFKDKWVYLTTSITALTPELQQQTSLDVYEGCVQEEEESEDVTFENFKEKLDSLSYAYNRLPISLYRQLYEPFLSDARIQELCDAAFDVPQKYYRLTAPNQDEHGLTPEFQFEHLGLGGAFIELSALQETQASMINGSLQEGPSRLHHIPRFSGYLTGYKGLIVSESVKQVLETFSLPPSATFVEVLLKPKRIKTSTQYYLFLVEEDQIYKDMNYEKAMFVYYAGNRFNAYAFREVHAIEEPPTCSDEVIPTVQRLYAQEPSDACRILTVYTERHLLNSTYDIYTHQQDWIVNECVKKALEQVCEGQVGLTSAASMRIAIDTQAYAQKVEKYKDLHFEPGTISVIKSATEKYYFEKAKRLQRPMPELPRQIQEEDEFSTIEDELQVLFPERFKAYFRKRHGKGGRGYQLLDIASFYPIEEDYTTRHFAAYKGVVVAHNGLGDALALLLEKEDDYKLGTTFYECLHESGDIKRKRSIPK